MRKLVIALFTLPITVGLSVWILMKGWGLEPASWSVIICGAVLQLIVLALMQAATSDSE